MKHFTLAEIGYVSLVLQTFQHCLINITINIVHHIAVNVC